VTPAHLAVALLAEPEGVTAARLQKLDVDPRVLAADIARGLDKLPRASGGQIGMSRALAQALQDAQAWAKKAELPSKAASE